MGLDLGNNKKIKRLFCVFMRAYWDFGVIQLMNNRSFYAGNGGTMWCK